MQRSWWSFGPCPLLACLILALSHTPARAVDYQKSLDQQAWHFNWSATNLLYCVGRDLHDYAVEMEYPKRPQTSPDRSLTVHLRTDGREVFRFRALPETVCTRSGDVLYIAEVDPRFNRCAVVATNLKTGTEIWRTQVQGIGLLKFSGYANQVTIEAEGEILIVRVHERRGRYVEYLDRKSGTMVAHRIYLPGPLQHEARLEKMTMLKILDPQTILLRSDLFLTHVHRDGGIGSAAPTEGPTDHQSVKLKLGESCLMEGKGPFDAFLLVRIESGKAVFRHSGVRRNQTPIDETVVVAPYQQRSKGRISISPTSRACRPQ